MSTPAFHQALPAPVRLPATLFRDPTRNVITGNDTATRPDDYLNSGAHPFASLLVLLLCRSERASPLKIMTVEKSETINSAENGFCYDPDEATQYLSSIDRTLGKLIERAGTFNLQLRPMPAPFEALARNIIYQQLHGNAAAAIHRRVLTLFGKKRLHPQDILAASEESLRGAGLSGAKLVALKDLAAKTLAGTVPTRARLRRMNDEEIIEHLTEVRGIGRWTVEMLLIFNLGRADVLPVGDFAVRKGFSLVYGLKELPTPKQLVHYGERWRPYRSVASWYLWRVHELPPETLREIALQS